MKNPLLITKEEILNRYKPIRNSTHKGIQGHALLIGGGYGKMGSVCLASKAALKTGCGLVTAFIPECGHDIVQIAIPEAMVITDTQSKSISEIKFDIAPNAIGIGPGMGQKQNTQSAVHKFLESNKAPLVIDADAINILSENQSWLTLLLPETIITPHQKELERLVGKWKDKEEKLQKVKALSKKHHLIVVVKGAPTIIVHKEKIYENTTGNAALATAGSGDVLTGMITSLLAQRYEPLDAAILGVYLHGLTADLAFPETGYQSFIASNIIENIGKAYLTLENL
ncbi:MAG TPA: NAD(P)H-hydrate dehydratase [Flavobacterium sp.]|nr:NAD(P)H-hydrate dehydratase [Flavobacterium sp.]